MESPRRFDDFLTVAFKEKMSLNLNNIEFEYNTSAAKLLNKRKELKETEELLLNKKQEFNNRIKTLEVKKGNFQNKQAILENKMKIYDQDFKDILSKRERAAKRYSNESEIRKSKEEEIEDKSNYLKILIKQRSQLQKQIEHKLIYKNYMDKVIDTADDFQEINDIIQRYDTLLTTKAELQKIANNSQTVLIEEKQKLNEIQETNDREMLILNNEIITLQNEYEDAKSKVGEFEETWNKIKNASTKDSLLAGQITIISSNLFDVIKNFHKINEGTDEEIYDTVKQLEKVQEYIEDLKQIATESIATTSNNEQNENI